MSEEANMSAEDVKTSEDVDMLNDESEKIIDETEEVIAIDVDGI
jgi:hypothetical protein